MMSRVWFWTGSVSTGSSLCILTFFTIVTNVHGQLTSPCPNQFKYLQTAHKDIGNRWDGLITLLPEYDLSEVFIDVKLDREATLLGNWFGSVSTADRIEFKISNTSERLQRYVPREVKIFVKYSANSRYIPTLQSIRLNGRQICPEQPMGSSRPLSIDNKSTSRPINTNHVNVYTQPVKTTTTRQGTVSYNQNNNYVNNKVNNDKIVTTYGNSNNHQNSQVSQNNPTYQSNNAYTTSNDNYRPNAHTENTYTQTTQRYSNSNQNNGYTTQRSSTQKPEEGFAGDFHWLSRPSSPLSTNNNALHEQIKCGTVEVQAKPLITYGASTYEGQWPWHAALYQSKGIDLTYICGASLISKRYIITAAHCVTKKQSREQSEIQFMTVYLGKYSLKRWQSPNIQNMQLERIYVHPNYNFTTFDNDIAVVKLIKDVQFNGFVRPVCLWSEDTDLSTITNREGTVVGWGYDETGRVTDELSQAQMPVVDQQTCLWSYPTFFSRFTSTRTFCAGFRNGTSVCNGDSGGGMVFPIANTYPTQWQLRGLVSLSVALQNELVCDTSHYVVFTDLAQHLSWVRNIINQ